MAFYELCTGDLTIIPAFCWCMGLTELNWTTLHYTTLHYTTLHYTTLHYTTLHYTTLHFCCCFCCCTCSPYSAVWDEYARLRWTNFLFTSLTSFNQQKFFFNIFLTICFICPTISIPGLQWHMLAALSGCPQMEHTKHTGRERQFESFERKTIDTVFFQL